MNNKLWLFAPLQLKDCLYTFTIFIIHCNSVILIEQKAVIRTRKHLYRHIFRISYITNILWHRDYTTRLYQHRHCVYISINIIALSAVISSTIKEIEPYSIWNICIGTPHLCNTISLCCHRRHYHLASKAIFISIICICFIWMICIIKRRHKWNTVLVCSVIHCVQVWY